jgi:hypothetical protein
MNQESHERWLFKTKQIDSQNVVAWRVVQVATRIFESVGNDEQLVNAIRWDVVLRSDVLLDPDAKGPSGARSGIPWLS